MNNNYFTSIIQFIVIENWITLGDLYTITKGRILIFVYNWVATVQLNRHI